MAGNSKRRGAVRKEGSKKGAVVGSGGQARRGLHGKGPTPPAELRPGHPKQRRAAAQDRRQQKVAGTRRHRAGDGETPETVLGRNPVVECLRAGVPATALQVAVGSTHDERVTEAIALAAEAGISILEVPRNDLDRITGGALHQGLALQVPPYEYAHPDALLENAADSANPALIVALDGVTDPRNLGAVVRSVGAFGGHGVVVPQRRAAGMTAVAWRTSAGTAARLPVARATNLTRTLQGVRAGRADGRRPGRGRRRLAGRVRHGGRAAGAGHRVRGQGPVPAGQGDLRRDGLDPAGRRGGVAQRRRRDRRGARRGRAPPPHRLTPLGRRPGDRPHPVRHRVGRSVQVTGVGSLDGTRPARHARPMPRTDGAHDRRLLLVSVWASAGFAVLSSVWGIASGSSMIVFDGVYSFLSIGLSLLAVAALRASRRGPDATYPWGREVWEPLVVVVKALALAALCIYAVVGGVTDLLAGGRAVSTGWALVYAVLATVGGVVVTLLMRRRAGSDLVRAEAAEWLGDTLLSVAVLVGFGVAVGLEAAGRPELAAYVDPAMVVLVSLLFLRVPAGLVVRGMREILSMSPPESVQDELRTCVEAVRERYGMDESFLRAAKVGSRIDVEVDYVVGDDSAVRTVADCDEVRRDLHDRLAALGHERSVVVAFTTDRRWAL